MQRWARVEGAKEEGAEEKEPEGEQLWTAVWEETGEAC